MRCGIRGLGSFEDDVPWEVVVVPGLGGSGRVRGVFLPLLLCACCTVYFSEGFTGSGQPYSTSKHS